MIKLRSLKIIAAVALTVVGWSCGGNKGDGDVVDHNSHINPDSLTTFEDSLTYAFARQQAAQLNATFDMLDEETLGEINKEDYLAGIRAALSIDTTRHSYFVGVAKGLEMAEQANMYNSVGIKFAPSTMKDPFFSIVKGDYTVDRGEYDELTGDFDRLFARVQNLLLDQMRVQRRKQAELDQKIRKANLDAASKFMSNLQKQDKSIRITDNGVYYKVLSDSTGAQPTDESVVAIDYSIKGIDGRIIDSPTTSETVVDMANIATQAPGFAEGLMQMHTGSHYILYVPAHLVNHRRAKMPVKPGEMIVIDVKLLDVRKPS